MRPTRRQIIRGLGASFGTCFGTGLVLAPAAVRAGVGPRMAATEFGLAPDTGADQSILFQNAVDRATAAGMALELPAGRYELARIALPARARIAGARGLVRLGNNSGAPILEADHADDISLLGLGFDGGGAQPQSEDVEALLRMHACDNLLVRDCRFTGFGADGISTFKASGLIEACQFSGFGGSAVHLQDSTGMRLTGCHVADCANGGIRVWRYSAGHDGTILTGNRIENIRSGSGNGQNGNGINIFRADGVIATGNVIGDCDFSALRANATANTILSDNQCFDCREVAIFSEFGFSGSVVTDNIVDRAAIGILITNLNDGGHLATCANNIVRNVMESSPTNPGTNPAGIVVQAETAVTGNVIEDVPGDGIRAGYGPYMRNVLISDNVVRRAEVGIALTVVEDAGTARVTHNLIAESAVAPMQGRRWNEVAAADLIAEADRHPHLTISDNTIL